MTPTEARLRRDREVAKRRGLESACAMEFLVFGDERGVHAKRCVFGQANSCSRTYDPWPVREATPDPGLHEGTGVGALYGLRGSERHLWQLAGWNLLPRNARRGRNS